MKNIYVMKEGGDAAKKISGVVEYRSGAKWEIKESTTNILVITVNSILLLLLEVINIIIILLSVA